MIAHLYTLLLLPAPAVPATSGGGVMRQRRTVQASTGWAPDNAAQLARARRRRRQQQFIAIHSLTH